MAVQVRQALVAIGGKASRLRADGVAVPASKAFLPLAGRPLLFWTLLALRQAGVTSVVLSGNETRFLYRAEQLLSSFGHRFQEVAFFQDGGLGVHALPYKIKHLLHPTFIFECGHQITQPSHYRALMKAKTTTNIVLTAVIPHPDNPRYPVRLRPSSAEPAEELGPGVYALAHPLVVDQAYSRQLLASDFNVKEVINHYAAHNQLAYVKSNLPPEFDIAAELQQARLVYTDSIKALRR
ncbi:MAG TPA: NTP transferase domain-containing protein [Candidatus Saccharimonadia bacterium]|nr:NTP transferase domain-containing protein [Candidatus Saccharimonadia bacterium]